MFTIGNEVWINEVDRAVVGKIVELKREFVVLETIQGKKLAVDRQKVRPIAELYKV